MERVEIVFPVFGSTFVTTVRVTPARVKARLTAHDNEQLIVTVRARVTVNGRHDTAEILTPLTTAVPV